MLINRYSLSIDKNDGRRDPTKSLPIFRVMEEGKKQKKEKGKEKEKETMQGHD